MLIQLVLTKCPCYCHHFEYWEAECLSHLSREGLADVAERGLDYPCLAPEPVS